MIKNIKWLGLVLLTIVACNNNDDDIIAIDYGSSDGNPLTSGTANFSKYVAVGNSLTAGFSDNALFIEGQKTSWSAILSSQFKLVGGGEFKIPFMADNVGGIVPSALGQFPRLVFNGVGPASLGLPPYNQVSTTTLVPLTGGFNNMGVPGAKSFHLLAPGYGNPANFPNANPYFVRFATAPNATILADAVAQSASFFSLWIGNNDVLSYATSGGTGTNQLTNINPATYSGNDITNTNVFAGTYNALLSDQTGLRKNGAKGVVANIPYVTSVPFFTTVVPNQIPGLAPTQVTDLNQLFGGINAALTNAGLPKRFSTLVADDGNAMTIESNPLLIVDETLVDISAQIAAALAPVFGPQGAAFLGNQYGRARHARSTVGDRDYILLTTAGLIRPTPAGNNIEPGLPPGLTPTFAARGVTFPLQDSAVLTADETAQVKTATDSFNMTIKNLAAQFGLAFVDANALLNQVATTGVTANGYTVTSGFVTGGGFSLDGVHPSPRGYALIANEFIKEINKTYGSNMSPVNLANYRILFGASL